MPPSSTRWRRPREWSTACSHIPLPSFSSIYTPRTMDSWFEVAVAATIFAIGNILFGHFEDRTPKWRRVTKVIVFLAVTRLITVQLGRPWSYLVIAIPLALVLVVHGWLLPRQSINGWTAEPKERYYKFRGWTLPPDGRC